MASSNANELQVDTECSIQLVLPLWEDNSHQSQPPFVLPSQ
nr:hypothetical protein [Moorena producens]